MTPQLKLFNEPYIFSGKPWQEARRTLLVGMTILGFFLLVRPFGKTLPVLSILWVGSGIISLAVVLQIGISSLIKKTRLKDSWTILAELIKTLVYLLLLAFSSALLMHLLGWIEFGTRSVSNFLLYTLAYSTLPIAISKLWEQNKRLTQKIRNAKVSVEPSSKVWLKSPVKNDQYEGLLEDIRYLQSDGNYVIIHEVQEKHHIRLTLKSAQEQLKGHGFLHVHRSFLVNPKCISRVMSKHLVLKDGTKISISRQFRKTVIEEQNKKVGSS